jgi:lipid-A-disaccharide synthase
MKIFFSVGEPSGDLHGANLIRALHRLRPDVQCVGFGGPRMKQAGCCLHADLTSLAVMWFLRALLNIGTFWRLIGQADRYFRHERPDAVVLIDYPGFNWWIARRAKVHRIPVFYYGAPQMWAWAGWRVKKMRRLVDHVLCKLSFETDWYRARGCNATYVGHPYFDELANRRLDESFVRTVHDPLRPLVTILPGSRTQEVCSNLACFLRTAHLVRQHLPQVRFAIAAFNDTQAAIARRALPMDLADVSVYTRRTPELIRAAECCLACSGSVSLELMYHEKPAVIHYWIGRVPFFVQGFFRKVRFITLANLLATEDRYCSRGEVYDPHVDDQKVPYPEYLTCIDRTPDMAQKVVAWLTNRQDRDKIVEQIQAVKKSCLTFGASERAARYILEHTAIPAAPLPTHYVPSHAA